MARIKTDKMCPLCKVFHELEIPVSEEKFLIDLASVRNNGDHIQNKLNYLSVDSRELLLTGYCTKGWDDLFGEEE